MIVAEGAGIILGKRIAVALPVRGAHERRHDVEVPLRDFPSLSPEIGQAEIDVELEQIDT